METGYDIIGIVKQYKCLANPSFKTGQLYNLSKQVNLALRLLVKGLYSRSANNFKAVLNCKGDSDLNRKLKKAVLGKSIEI